MLLGNKYVKYTMPEKNATPPGKSSMYFKLMWQVVYHGRSIYNKSRPNETHITVRGAQTVTSILSIAPSGSNVDMYFLRQMVTKDMNVILQYIVPSIFHLAMVMAGSAKRVNSHFIISKTCSIGERSGNIAGQGSCCTPRRTCCIAAAMPALSPEGATLCTDVTVWAPLTVTCVFHLVWICCCILLQW